jgi:hypothetical protein
MPDRYWVGGTDSWNGTAGLKWSATSGGAGGASVPTTADDVFFDANSGASTVTIASGNTGAKSINCTGFTGTLAGSTDITIAGSITLVAGMTFTYTGITTISGSSTITSAGKTLPRLIISGAGITVDQADALSLGSQQLVMTQGTFNTNNFNLTCGFLQTTGTSTKALNLGSSTVTTNSSGFMTFFDSTNFTFNAGTSTITNSSAVVSMLNTGSFTFHNVSFTSTGAGIRTIAGTNTFNNFTLNASADGVSGLSLGANQTVNGTFTCAGSSAIKRGYVRSTVPGTARTVTAAAVSAADCDFEDITIAGAAAPISPTRAGNCGGNSGITFPAAKTAYRVGTNTLWWGSSSWALTSGGAGSDDNYPLPQDTAVIDENTVHTGTIFYLGQLNIGTFDASTRTTGITLSYGGATRAYGSCTFGSGITATGLSSQIFAGRGTMVFTSAGKTITFPIQVDSPGGTFQLGDAYSASNTVSHNRGTFDANGYNLTCTTFSSSNSNVRTITMGAGLWTLSGTGTIWDTTTTTNLTFNKNTANILLSNTTSTGRTFAGGGLSYNKLTIGGTTGTSVLTISGANSFTEIASTKTVAHTVRLSVNQGTIDTWSITGTSGNVVTVDSSAAGTRRTFNLTNSTAGTVDYLNVKDIGVNQANRFFVGDNSTDSGNNLNVIFNSGPVLGTGNFFMLFN